MRLKLKKGNMGLSQLIDLHDKQTVQLISAGVMGAPVVLICVPLQVSVAAHIQNMEVAVTGIDQLPSSVLAFLVQGAEISSQSQDLAALGSKAKGAVVILSDNQDFLSSDVAEVASSSIYVNTHIVVAGLDHGQSLVMCGVDNDDLVAAVQLGNLGESAGDGRCFGFGLSAEHDLSNLAAGVKLDGAVVILDDTANNNDVADLQAVCPLALQAIALDRLILKALDLDGNSNVAVAGIIGGVHSADGPFSICSPSIASPGCRA